MIADLFKVNTLLIGNIFALVALVSCTQPQPTSTMNISNIKSMTNNTDTATFGAGCFWCVEAIFQQLDGVLKVTSGYTGGHIANPTYEQVCSKTTGHVEVAQVVYDPAKLSYDELLEVFWKTHDPTTLNQQGNDQGPQYRSAIFYHNNEQKNLAEKYKTELERAGAWTKPITTTIEPLGHFYAAENYHQNYFNTNPGQLYCRYVVQPKVEKFQKVFKSKLRQKD